MEAYVKITAENLKDFYLNPKGNLYYRVPRDYKGPEYHLIEDFTLEECEFALKDGILLIYKEGPAQATILI